MTWLGFCCTKTSKPPNTLYECQWTAAADLVFDARNWVFRLVHASHCPCSGHRYKSRYLQLTCLRGYPIPFHQFLRVFLWCSWLLFPCFTLPSVRILSEVPNGHLSRDGNQHVSWAFHVTRTAFSFLALWQQKNSLYWPIHAYTGLYWPILRIPSSIFWAPPWPRPWQFKLEVPSFEETPELLLLGELRRQLFILKRAIEARHGKLRFLAWNTRDFFHETCRDSLDNMGLTWG